MNESNERKTYHDLSKLNRIRSFLPLSYYVVRHCKLDTQYEIQDRIV